MTTPKKTRPRLACRAKEKLTPVAKSSDVKALKGKGIAFVQIVTSGLPDRVSEKAGLAKKRNSSAGHHGPKTGAERTAGWAGRLPEQDRKQIKRTVPIDLIPLLDRLIALHAAGKISSLDDLLATEDNSPKAVTHVAMTGEVIRRVLEILYPTTSEGVFAKIEEARVLGDMKSLEKDVRVGRITRERFRDSAIFAFILRGIGIDVRPICDEVEARIALRPFLATRRELSGECDRPL